MEGGGGGGGAWPYPIEEEPLIYPIGHPAHYYPQQAYQGHVPPNYGPVPHQGPFQPHHDILPPHDSLPPHFQEGVVQNAPLPYHNYAPHYLDDIQPHFPYQYKESEWDDEEDDDDDDEDDSLPSDSIEEALQELNIHLPRLAVIAPPSVIPPKGGGRCVLPNLGNSNYINAIIQCLYHTPTFPASLALGFESLQEGQQQRGTAARTLTALMTKMDDLKLMKKGLISYFKGVCGLRDETFAGLEQQDPNDFLVGLLLWLHQDLAVREEVDCACTKYSLTKPSTTTTTTTTANAASTSLNTNVEHRSSPPQGHRTHHHHHHPSPPPPGNTNQYYHKQHQHPRNNHHHHHHNSQKSSVVDSRKEGRVCDTCGVTYQRRSCISDMFEGIHQVDVICARVGIILHTAYHRFTSLSVPLTAPTESTLEEALQQYYGVSMVMWDCDYCTKSHLCHQQIRLLCSPRILVVHLSRPTKVHNVRGQSVNYPIDHLTLQDHMIPGKKERSGTSKYSLYAVCNHDSTRTKGHYTALCRANRYQTHQGNWFLFDNEKVSETRFNNSKEACILFYRNPGMEMR